MLRINRLRIEIETNNGIYGIDESFDIGLNFLASEDNTCGKSSIIEAIYYGLGFEEIIGGKGEKVLTSAYKTYIEDGDKRLSVLESKIYLEISNGKEVVTVFRTAKMKNRDSRLITVYYSTLDKIYQKDVLYEDMYVLMPNASLNYKGYHYFLEKFLHLELPKVTSTDGNKRKLYLQLIFSCMFIEQKHGWGDIFSGIPFLGIKDSKQKVIEYVLGLDTFNNEKQKEDIKLKEVKIKNSWEFLVKESFNTVYKDNFQIMGIPLKPKIISQQELDGIRILKDNYEINTYLSSLQKEYDSLSHYKPKVVDNFDILQKELEEVEEEIRNYEVHINLLREELRDEKISIQVLNNNLEIIENDIRNNKDAARLRKIGSKLDCMSSKNICPVCQQEVEDSLLPVIGGMQIMSLDENIRHLEAQKKMLDYAKESREDNKNKIDMQIQTFTSKMFSLRRLAKVIRSDLYSVDENVSATIIHKKIELQNQIEKTKLLVDYIEEVKLKFFDLSNQWKEYLDNKEKIPKKLFSELDQEKLELLKRTFIYNLNRYGYKSVLDIKDIDISHDTYLPIIKEFDMKFDSSASDNIRAIWAYTVALLQTSIEKGGNHPTVLIFDEPNQHSIISEDMYKFFESLIELGDTSQTIVGITIKDSDTKNTLSKLEKSSYKLILVGNKAFKKFDKKFL